MKLLLFPSKLILTHLKDEAISYLKKNQSYKIIESYRDKELNDSIIDSLWFIDYFMGKDLDVLHTILISEIQPKP